MERRLRRDLFRTLGVFAVVLGILGSLTAWETGQIGFVQAMVQALFSAELSYLAFTAAVNTRRRKTVRHRPVVMHTDPRPAGRTA